MPQVVITPAAMDTLPAVCVLTGRCDDVVFRPLTFRQRVALPGVCAVTSRCEVSLPFQRAAWRAFVRRRAAIEVGATVACVTLGFALLASAGDAVRLGAALVGFACVGIALGAWLAHRRRTPRLVTLAEDGLGLDVPSGEAAQAIGRYVDEVEVECRRARRRALEAERQLAKLRGSPLATPR